MTKIYQSYLGDDQRQLLSEDAIPWSVEDNTSTSTREYELFKQVAMARRGNKEPWGLVSAKFANKSLMQISSFIEFADKKFDEGFDCVFVNPMIGNEALYFNVWQQGVQSGHLGLEIISQYLESYLELPINAPMDRNTFAFCNYFVAKPHFWLLYFSFVDHALNGLEQEAANGTEVGNVYTGSGSYSRDLDITMKPFVVERLFSTFIQHCPVKVTSFAFSKSHYEEKFGSKLGAFLFQVSALKNKAIGLRDRDLLATYDQIRDAVYCNPVISAMVFSLDDTPDFFTSQEYSRLMAKEFSFK